MCLMYSVLSFYCNILEDIFNILRNGFMKKMALIKGKYNYYGNISEKYI